MVVAGRERQGVLALRDASPLRTMSVRHDLGGALERCDFVVSFSPYLDEAAAAADLLLPTHTPLESWQAIVPPPADPSDRFACSAPAAHPRLDTRDVIVILRAAADAVGQGAAMMPWKSSSDVVHATLGHLWTLRRGVPYTSVFENEWVRQLERGGWWVPPVASGDEFAEAALRAGGWVDPFFAPGAIRQALAGRGGLRFTPPAASLGVSARADDGSTSVVPASLDLGPNDSPTSREFPLRLAVFTPAVVNLVGGPNQPLLFELLGQPDGAPWRVWAEMSPETAGDAGVGHGAAIRISSASASIEALAMIVERMPTATIAVAYVPAIASGGRWTRQIASDARRLLDGRKAGESVAVRVTRA